MRAIFRDGVEWRVREIGARSASGASREHCLIFDSDSIVRRCWTYPANWNELTNDALWALLSAHGAAQPPSAVAAVSDALAASTPIRSDAGMTQDANRAVREGRTALLESCGESRDAMLAAVERYARTLKQSGVEPESAIVLIKDTLQRGLGGAAKCEEPEEGRRFVDGVARGISAYYAA